VVVVAVGVAICRLGVAIVVGVTKGGDTKAAEAVGVEEDVEGATHSEQGGLIKGVLMHHNKQGQILGCVESLPKEAIVIAVDARE